MSASISRVDGHSIADAELEDAVNNAILRYGTLRVWGHAMSVEANQGVITLSGHVRTRVSKTTVESVVRQVSGVRDVKNELIVDTDLEIAVAQALANDPRSVKGFPGILVGSGFGEVFLKGAVASPEIKAAAGEIAARVAGVRTVTNELVAPEPPKPAAAAKPVAKPAPKPAPKPVEDETESSEE
jgi:osmotically-inducible protein OsmY